MAKLLEVKNLRTYFYTDDGVARSVDGVSYDVDRGETLGVVGESGCGKSVTALSIMRLIPDPPGKIEGGEILYNGTNLLDLSEERMRGIRGNEISMIFQEPMTSLNPVFTVGHQIDEAVILPECQIGRKVRLRKVVVDRGVRIPEGMVVGEDPVLDGERFRRTESGVCLITQPMIDRLG